MNILVLSDIHGNYPALQAIDIAVQGEQFSHVLNSGDSTVYAPFPNECLAWLRTHGAISIRGNTDDKVIRLLKGKAFLKPSKPDKRCMYDSTFAALDEAGKQDLLAMRKTASIELPGWRIGLFHGSPEDHEEFLFSHTPDERFAELAKKSWHNIIITGHSHSPYYKHINGVHFINPGSAGRMFDGDPRAAYAILHLGKAKDSIKVELLRASYDVEAVAQELERQGLPVLYGEMFRQGRKLN